MHVYSDYHRHVWQITVERSDNRVLADRIIGMAFPLSDARTASIRHNSSPNLWKASIIPSRSAVARICSEPGLTIKGAATAKCFQLPDGQWKQPDLNPDKRNWYMNLSARLPSYADNH